MQNPALGTIRHKKEIKECELPVSYIFSLLPLHRIINLLVNHAYEVNNLREGRVV